MIRLNSYPLMETISTLENENRESNPPYPRGFEPARYRLVGPVLRSIALGPLTSAFGRQERR